MNIMIDEEIEHQQKLEKTISSIFENINELKSIFKDKKREFTIDGRLVGDIGEVIAERYFDITLINNASAKNYDAISSLSQNVQIKATFKNSLTFKNKEGYFLGLKLDEQGGFKLIYNGLSSHIYNHFQHRKGITEQLLSFPINKLEELNELNDVNDRVPLRKV